MRKNSFLSKKVSGRFSIFALVGVILALYVLYLVAWPKHIDFDSSAFKVYCPQFDAGDVVVVLGADAGISHTQSYSGSSSDVRQSESSSYSGGSGGHRGIYPDRVEDWELCDGNLRLEQNDTKIVNYIRKHHLFPPSKKEYDLTPQQPWVDKIWKNLVANQVFSLLRFKRNGFFIECGANDGQFLSNTLLFETKYGWSGLLVESDPRSLEKLTKRHRKSWITNVCLSTVPYPVKVAMLRHKSWEAMSFIPKFNIWRTLSDYEKFEAQCFPLFSILTALNVTEIDYFSLDIEGAELKVLQTLPFETVLIKVLSIETAPGTEGPMEKFMTSKGYILVTLIEETHTRDQIYIHRSLY